MSVLSNHPNIVKFEARSAEELEEIFSRIDKAFTPISIYGMNGRHYAWISLHAGIRKKVVKTNTIVSESKKENVKL